MMEKESITVARIRPLARNGASHAIPADKGFDRRIWSKMILRGQGEASSATVKAAMQMADINSSIREDRSCSLTICLNDTSLPLPTFFNHPNCLNA